eukprot:CAMPEP_0184867870 /NCGR_PEP_ID=MMETSP0580-20130426/28014_1 /TAXON_ID=1118495 /ORGANISM="Dactyliosolen fragilissimus" /LENGTH=584 /DNA_ID=CAMNT_0027368349 /DNA_START=267 /DNA_END=2024 /DNA_ORIENTATION=-
MREEQAKKNIPMASEAERENDAPGLRVGTNAWKWPPVWPYQEESFMRPKEIPKAPTPNLSTMMTGGIPDIKDEPVSEEVEKLNILKYWSEENTAKTEIDEEAAEKIRSHYGFYLRDGMSVLEFGAAEESYLPENIKLASHVGVGASKKLMEENSALTKVIVADLNDVEEEKGVNSDDLRSLGANSFDVILMANTIDFLTSPREVFKSAWYLLKPGGTMIVSFANKDAYTSKFQEAQTKMWMDMTDDQHMWICGSFFQFSAGSGWENLKGFDISPEESQKKEGLQALINQNQKMNMYVVQASKAFQDDSIDPNNPEKSFRSKMWLLPTMEDRDKQLLAPRLARAFQSLKNDDEKDAIARHVDVLPRVYESLVKMDTFSFTFSMQAQLAADLVTDKDFDANDEQILALKMGLGLRAPSKEFWEPVGRLTGAMVPEDKVNLLAHIVPRFGSGDPNQEACLGNFVTGLSPTFSVLKSKSPGMTESDIQLLGTEMLAAEILKPGRSSKEQFASWLGSLTEEEMKEYLKRRKSFKELAIVEMKEMQAERQAEKERIEEYRKKMMEQQEKARAERSMAFNPETGKMEKIES